MAIGVTVMGLLTVMSSLACRMTLAPASRLAVKAGVSVTVWPGSRAKETRLGSGSPTVTRPLFSAANKAMTEPRIGPACAGPMPALAAAPTRLLWGLIEFWPSTVEPLVPLAQVAAP